MSEITNEMAMEAVQNDVEEIKKPEVTVVDVIMGAGKTSWAIQYMNENPQKRFIYCTPFLQEVERICAATQRRFYQPMHRQGNSKLEDFNNLLKEKCNIVLTHATFINATAETMELLRAGSYHLIMDEVVNVLEDFNKACNETIRRDDIRMLIDEGFIQSDDVGKITWLKDSYPGSKYGSVERVANAGYLRFIDNQLMWELPPALFDQFESMLRAAASFFDELERVFCNKKCQRCLYNEVPCPTKRFHEYLMWIRSEFESCE